MAGLSFDGAVAIVTGGGTGIGRASALEMGRRGARVLVNNIRRRPEDPDRAGATVADIVAMGGEAVANHAAVNDRAACAEMIEEVMDRWGRINIIQANAGNMKPAFFTDLQPADFNELLDVHLGGLVNLAQPAWPWMIKGGGGQLVATSSMAGLAGGPGHGNYAAAKMAQAGVMKVIACEGAPHGIRINAVLPWARGTPLGASVAKSAIYASGTAQVIYGDADLDELTPERVASLMAALSHRSCPWNGEFFVACGRYYTRVWYAFGTGYVSQDSATAEELAAHWHDLGDHAGAAEIPLDTVQFGIQALARMRNATVTK